MAGAALFLSAAGALVFFALRTEVAPPLANAAAPTFSKHVGPLVHERCAPCHRPGGSAPFELLTYEDVRDRAPQIREVVRDRFMPPWKPVGERGVFVGDRSLSDTEIAVLTEWIDAEMPIGDNRRIPPPPEWRDGWKLGQPDLVVELPEPYPLPPDGRDVYTNIVIAGVVDGPRFVGAWEFQPRGRAIHHAILNIDRTGYARARDADDPALGYRSMDAGNVQAPGGFYAVWTPGKAPGVFDSSWLLDPHTDLVLQLHMQPTGKPEKVRPAIGLYFTERPPARRHFTVRFGDPDIDIPAGEPAWSFTESYRLDAAVRVVSMFPHAHYIAKKVRVWAELPDGGKKELLRIDDWDFNWQDAYRFVQPVPLPAKTTLFIRFEYDNSAANVQNPHSPPKRVKLGEQSTDEMGNVTFQLEPVDPRGLDVLDEAKYRRMLEALGDARSHYNLANVLARRGKVEEAIEHYGAAIAASPAMAPAHYNLGTLYLSLGRHDEAVKALEAAIAAKAPNPRARTNLGHALEARGDRDSAIAAYRKALEEDGSFFPARASLGRALAAKGDHRGAVEQFEKAAALRPDNEQVRRDLEEAIAARDGG